MQSAINAGESKTLYRAVKIFYPSILEEMQPLLVKPAAILVHTVLLPKLLKSFCELKEVSERSVIGIHQGGEASQLKTLFVAVVITLYDPQTLTGIHSDSMKPSLAKEIAGLLEVDRTWISQQASKIRTLLNPHKAKPAYEDFRGEVKRISKVLEIEFAK